MKFGSIVKHGESGRWRGYARRSVSRGVNSMRGLFLLEFLPDPLLTSMTNNVDSLAIDVPWHYAVAR
jgi:hypothetical protein